VFHVFEGDIYDPIAIIYFCDVERLTAFAKSIWNTLSIRKIDNPSPYVCVCVCIKHFNFVSSIFLSDVCGKSDGAKLYCGLKGFGLNLGIPTENVVIRNITCAEGGRGGFAIGSEMSGGLRNITYVMLMSTSTNSPHPLR